MASIEDLQKEIELIKERNRRVEKDKDWETSWTRKVAISLITYFLVLLFMLLTENTKPFVSALIPSVAFLLSSATLGLLKNWWLKNKKY